MNAIIADHLRKNRVCRIDLKGDSRVVDVINSNKNVYLDSAAERDQIGITLIILDREQRGQLAQVAGQTNATRINIHFTGFHSFIDFRKFQNKSFKFKNIFAVKFSRKHFPQSF